MKTESLKLSRIVTTAGTQIRAQIDGDTVSDYAEAMRDGAKFPPVVCFHDGNQYILADGFHRVFAAVRNEFLDILADVRKGTRSDALRFALSANAAHGLKRTNADKRRSVELALAEWPNLSDRAIAETCGVSNQFVANMRPQVSTVDTSAQPAPKRTGKDGKEYSAPKAKKAAAPEKAEQPEPTEADVDEAPHIQTADEILHPSEAVAIVEQYAAWFETDVAMVRRWAKDTRHDPDALNELATVMEQHAKEFRNAARRIVK